MERHRQRQIDTQGPSPGAAQVLPAQQKCLLYGEEVKPIKPPQIFEMAKPTFQGGCWLPAMVPLEEN